MRMTTYTLDDLFDLLGESSRRIRDVRGPEPKVIHDVGLHIRAHQHGTPALAGTEWIGHGDVVLDGHQIFIHTCAHRVFDIAPVKRQVHDLEQKIAATNTPGVDLLEGFKIVTGPEVMGLLGSILRSREKAGV